VSEEEERLIKDHKIKLIQKNEWKETRVEEGLYTWYNNSYVHTHKKKHLELYKIQTAKKVDLEDF
jgi:hypothetical protein